MARSNSKYVTGRPFTIAATFEDTGRVQLAISSRSTLEAATEMPRRLLGPLTVFTNALCFRFLNLFHQCRNDFEQIANYTVICGFENRRVFVFIDGHNRL
jgi:hypothetical protein